MNEGAVALTPLPQADGKSKNRPIILLRRMPPFGDWLVCGVSTQVQQQVEGFDEMVGPADADYRDSGLKAPSLIRLGFLAVLPANQIAGSIGAISPERHSRLLARLSSYLAPRKS